MPPLVFPYFSDYADNGDVLRHGEESLPPRVGESQPFQYTQGKSARCPTAFTSISHAAGSPPGSPVFRVSDTFG